MATKFPANVIVLGVISNYDVMPLHIFPKGLRVNTDEYLHLMIKTVVKPWMDQIARNRHYIFQQDGAPTHNSKKTQDCLRRTSRRCGRRRSGLPAHLTATLWTILCGA
jgi:hypothetical protein